MFQKPAFGTTNTSAFGSFNAGSSTASPFGGFKSTTGTSAFGAPPAFGAAASTQPTAGTGLFGSSNTTGGLFGNTTASTSTPAFGASTSTFGGFGATTSSGGLFNNSSGGLFAPQNTAAFGAKPQGTFGFGGTTTTQPATGGLFGSAPATGSSMFPQQNTTLGGGGGLFNNTGAFGQQQTASGTGHVKYNPVVGTDVVVKSGTSQNINIKHHCITCMKEYENKSLEELRLEDYTAGRKGQQAGGMFGGGFTAQTETKPLFGGSTFGQQPATTSSSVFGPGGVGGVGGVGVGVGGGVGGGGAGAGGFGAFSFAAPQQPGAGLFAAKPAQPAAPAGTGLFGATTTQAPTFGTNTSSFGFGGSTAQSGLFAQKPPAFTPATQAFSGFGSAMFPPKPQQPAGAFGTAPAFGGLSSSFGTTTSSAGGLFTGAPFGKPNTAQPMGFNTQPTMTSGTGLGGLGTNAFQAKPAGPFGTLGGGSIFQPQQQTNNFLSKPDGSLGGFNSSFGQPSLGLGGAALGGGPGASAAGNVHDRILTLAARPYGDSPLFKHLLPEGSTTAEDVLKPTNPAAMKAVLDNSASAGYRVTSPGTKLRLQPRTSLQGDKKSLFDGLEESDASLEDKLSLKPSKKRLVLRSNHVPVDTNERDTQHTSNRSLENQQYKSTVNGDEIDSRKESQQPVEEPERPKRVSDNGLGYDVYAGKGAYWKSPGDSSPPQFPHEWDNEKSIDGEPTPRLYPNIDKEINSQTSERRASWLTTKPLRKPVSTNQDNAESSVRELRVREKEDRESRAGAPEPLQFCSHRGGITTCSCEKIAHQIQGVYVSEEEHVSPRPGPPHPAGVKLTRPGYYTIPTLDEMIAYMRPDGSCVVPHLTIGRHNYGNVFYDCEVDVAGLDLDALVHFLNKEVIVYPEDGHKPPVGQGLNRRAVVTLDRVWPRDKTQKRPIADPDRLLKMEYESKLRRVCDKHDTKFIEYRPATGSWVFRVEHFSKYGLTDSDEEDDGPTPDVLKRQLVKQAVQKTAAPPAPKPVAVQSPGLGGLGGMTLASGLSGLGSGEDTLLAMHQTSLNLLNGAGKAFEMDTTEDNTESQSLYQDHRAFGVKSPTSELARLENRQSHHVQLMKASLYVDTEMEDDISVSTGDQLVPISSVPAARPPSVRPLDEQEMADDTLPDITEAELPMMPLLVQPHTIVLKYHRKVPPFSQTIAGRLDAAYIADMSVCRARHSRVGFGPRATLAYVTSYDSIADLPKNAELSELGKYVRGRAEDDWSESVVARLRIADGDSASYIQEALTRHMETLLEFSTLVTRGEGVCPALRVQAEPAARRRLLHQHLRDAAGHAAKHQWGVSSAYNLQVWTLCEALWGADLDNGGVPATDVGSIVNRHRKILEWLKDAVADITDDELSKPSPGEKEDEEDGHSSRVLTLMLGGRILEACKVAREHGDLNMATLIAQSAGEPTFRSLVSRQLSLWRECGAESRLAGSRAAALRLAAGAAPRDPLLPRDWLRALHAAARYLCPQVPTLERVIQTYEGFFRSSEDEPVDLTTVEVDEMDIQLPMPPYMTQYELRENGSKKRVMDLRYELIRARAFHTRPTVRPASYSPDPLDYSLSFLLGTWFGNAATDSITGVAAQLERCGLWHRAVQALAYHPDDTARGHLIRGVLSRHAPAKANTPDLVKRLDLIKRLEVPAEWLLLAQAHRAKYEHLPRVEAEHLVGAGEWNAAHTVLVDQLLPTCVLADDVHSLSSLLEDMNEAASRHAVSGWESGGLALYHYLHVCDEIRGLVSAAQGGAAARLQALRPRVAAACRALKMLKPKTPRHAAARAEMGARLVQLALAAGEPPHHLAAILQQLQLPPDCTAHAYFEITTDIADQAADGCIDSVTSSPLSSHHRLLHS